MRTWGRSDTDTELPDFRERRIRVESLKELGREKVEPGPPFGGSGSQNEDTVPEICHGHVIGKRRGEEAPQAPVEFGQGMGTLQQAPETFAATGHETLE